MPQVGVFYELSLAAAMAGCFYQLINVVFFDRVLLAYCLSASGPDVHIYAVLAAMHPSGL